MKTRDKEEQVELVRLYPASYFVQVELPHEAEQFIAAAG
jgi:hypothetical protein